MYFSLIVLILGTDICLRDQMHFHCFDVKTKLLEVKRLQPQIGINACKPYLSILFKYKNVIVQNFRNYKFFHAFYRYGYLLQLIVCAMYFH